MSDLISRQAVLMRLADYQLQESPNWGANGMGNTDAYEAITECIRVIEQAPTIDPAENGGCWGCQCALCGQYPVKHGEWIYDKGLYRCSACNNLLTEAGWDIPVEQIYKSFKFCPNCGAKMDDITL